MRRVREVLLSLGAALGAVCLLLGLLAVTTGVHVLLFRSGSMSPTIDTGDLALSRTVAAADLRAGDVVSVLDSSGSRVTHRVVDLAAQGDSRQLTLQGDANAAPDREVHTVTEAQRVLLVVPKAGYVVAATTSPVGLVLLGGYAMFLLSVLFRRTDAPDQGDDSEGHRGPPRRTPSRRRAGRATGRTAPALIAIVAGGALATMPAPAWAAPWTDPVTLTGTSLSAATISPPGSFRCNGLGVLSVSFAWNAVAGATSYTLHYGSGGSQTQTVSGTTATVTSAISGGTAWVVANRSFGAVTWSSLASNTRSYTVAVVSLCG